jgi:hypothetical protein
MRLFGLSLNPVRSKANEPSDFRDTFVGMYSVEYITQKHAKEWKIGRAIARACKASARTIERLGAQESIPWGDETAV